MKKLITIVATLAMLAMMSVTAFAADGIPKTDDVEATAPQGTLDGTANSVGSSTALGGTDGTAWTHGIDDDDSITAGDTLTDIYVWAHTTQTDAYKVTIEWGAMSFNYAFGTWDLTNHTWSGTGWNNDDFDGTTDQVKVTNHSSQPISADLSCTTAAVGGTVSGTFTAESGNTGATSKNAITLSAYPVGGPAPSDKTYLKLAGIPSHIGTTVTKIAIITVTITS